MSNEKKFEELLKRFFNNVNKFGMVNFSSSEIYHNPDITEARIVFGEVHKIIVTHLIVREHHQAVLAELPQKIRGMQDQKGIDELVAVFANLHSDCYPITPTFLNLFEIFDRELNSFLWTG